MAISENELRNNRSCQYCSKQEEVGVPEGFPSRNLFDDYGCPHLPDTLDFIDSEVIGDTIINTYYCSCGKTVNEYFIFSERTIS